MKNNTGTKVLVITITVFIAIGAILLLVANRFWFEHPEVLPSQPAPSGAILPSPLTTQRPNADTSSEPPIPSASPTPTPTPAPTPRVKGGELLESYQDEGLTLSLRRFETGEGQEKVTFFVAEILLDDMSRLGSGFAKDTFGRNYQELPSSIATRLGAILAVNGDYYGYRDDGVIIRNGILYRDAPAQRQGAAFLPDGNMIVYTETEDTAAELLRQGALHSFSFGPILLEDGQMPATIETDRSAPLNPRTAIGMIQPGHYIMTVVDGRLKGYSQGMTLKELAEMMASFGCVTAYNLDGGGSSTIVWNGSRVNKPQGKDHERASSDILYLK